MKQLLLNDNEHALLVDILDTYIKDNLEGDLQDDTTTNEVVLAFGLQAKLQDNSAAWQWAAETLHTRNKNESN